MQILPGWPLLVQASLAWVDALLCKSFGFVGARPEHGPGNGQDALTSMLTGGGAAL